MLANHRYITTMTKKTSAKLNTKSKATHLPITAGQQYAHPYVS